MGRDTAPPAADVPRLGFLLHEFLRLSWVNDRVYHLWALRFRRIARAWPKLELASVTLGYRDLALLRLSSEGYVGAAQIASGRGVSAVLLGRDPSAAATEPSGRSFKKLDVAFGRPASLSEFERAWSSEASQEVGRMLGYPQCCVEAFGERCVEAGWIDPTWIVARQTREPDATGTIRIDQSAMTNIFWRQVGIRTIPHIPCRLDCQPSLATAEQFLEVGRQAGFAEETAWLQEILSWPVEWSALHGIAELKSPVLRMAFRTDATPDKLVVRWVSDSYPEHGATGVMFPYKPAAQVPLTQSKVFQMGLKHAAKTTNEDSVPR